MLIFYTFLLEVFPVYSVSSFHFNDKYTFTKFNDFSNFCFSDNCGGIYTDDHGNFTSPQYPNNYPNNMECVHIIQVEDGKAIQLDFDR